MRLVGERITTFLWAGYRRLISGALGQPRVFLLTGIPSLSLPLGCLCGWLFGTSRRFLFVCWDMNRYPECEIALPFDQIARVKCSENILPLPGLRPAWTIDILQGKSGQYGLSLRWDDKPMPKTLDSIMLAALGALVKAGGAVMERQVDKMVAGREVMTEIERFFKQIASSPD